VYQKSLKLIDVSQVQLTYFLWSPMSPYQTSCSLFLLSSIFFFPRLISAVGDWMSTILLHMAWP